MAEMHRTLRVLRGDDDDAGARAAAGPRRARRACSTARAPPGCRLTVAVEGAPRPLAPGARRLRVPDRAGGGHERRPPRGPARATTVTLRYRPDALELDVADEGGGRRRAERRRRPRPGRDARAGGAVRRHARRGPRATGGGFEVHAVLPYPARSRDEPAARRDRRRPAADARGLPHRARGDRRDRGRGRGRRRARRRSAPPRRTAPTSC